MKKSALEIIKENQATKEKLIDLGNCGLTDKDFIEGQPLHEELTQCNHLETLILSNKWWIWGGVEKWWEPVPSKNSDKSNFFQSIPAAISKLTNLSKLICCGEEISNPWKIKDISILENLKQLVYLDLRDNLVEDLAPLANSVSLEILYINRNQIRDLSPLSKLKKLSHLDIHTNKFHSIDGLSGLVSLVNLDINNNDITDISPLLNLGNLDFVNLDSTPIRSEIPEEVIASGWKAVKDRFILGNLINFQGIKILLLGMPNVGKSNLLEYLETGKEPISEQITFGIQYKCLENVIPGIKIHCWDFGGQEYFHATHSMFFSPGALNLVLWSKQNIQRNKSDPEPEYDLDYWIRCVETLGSDSKTDTEIIIIENKLDLQEYKITPINQLYYTEKYKNINFNFTSINLKPLKRTGSLKELIEELATGLLSKHPSKYNEFYKKIQNSHLEFIKIKDLARDDDNIVKNAMEVFHNMGIVLYFPDIIPDTVFIKPQALLDFLYKKLLNDTKNSQITTFDINEAIKENKLGLSANNVICLLKHFDLIFEIPEIENVFFVPQYLEPKEPFLDFFQPHQFQKANIYIKSDNYLMNSVMLKLFSKYGRYVKGGKTRKYLFWKDGIIIEKDDKLLQIVLDRKNQRIMLYQNIQAKDFSLLKEVVQFILQITKHKKNTSPNQTSVNVEQSNSDINWESKHFEIFVSLDGDFFASWNDLLKNSENGINSIVAFELVAKDNMNKLQNSKTLSIFNFNEFLPENKKGKMKKLFISYSKQDIRLVKEFIHHLSALQRDGILAHWYCSELEAGSSWNDEIQQRLNDADLICFMVSPNFIKTDYIYRFEIPKAFERLEQDKSFKIVPIILDFCRWTTTKNNLGDFTALPYTAKPIVDFGNQNMAWFIVIECLRLMIEKDLNPKDDKFFTAQVLPEEVSKLYPRIVEGKVDKNT